MAMRPRSKRPKPLCIDELVRWSIPLVDGFPPNPHRSNRNAKDFAFPIHDGSLIQFDCDGLPRWNQTLKRKDLIMILERTFDTARQLDRFLKAGHLAGPFVNGYQGSEECRCVISNKETRPQGIGDP